MGYPATPGRKRRGRWTAAVSRKAGTPCPAADLQQPRLHPAPPAQAPPHGKPHLQAMTRARERRGGVVCARSRGGGGAGLPRSLLLRSCPRTPKGMVSIICVLMRTRERFTPAPYSRNLTPTRPKQKKCFVFRLPPSSATLDYSPQKALAVICAVTNCCAAKETTNSKKATYRR